MNILITMSGGTTQVINSTLYGIIKESNKNNNVNLFYSKNGLYGFMNGDINSLKFDHEELESVRILPGSSVIGTSRIAPLASDSEKEHLALEFKKNNITHFINIGGNGTLKQSKHISSFVRGLHIASAAKTIDNDLGDKEFEKCYFTPGFLSVANFWKNHTLMLLNENFGAYTHDTVLVAQTFGRDTGFIAGTSALVGRDREDIMLLLPEDQRSPEEILNEINNRIERNKKLVIIMAEGYKINSFEKRTDLSGQIMWGSSSSTACQELVNLCMENKIQARLYNPTVLQRQDLQYRLDSDLLYAENIGRNIIKQFYNGNRDFFMSINNKFEYEPIPFETITDYSRSMLPEWIDFGNYTVSEMYVKYLNDIGVK